MAKVNIKLTCWQRFLKKIGLLVIKEVPKVEYKEVIKEVPITKEIKVPIETSLDIMYKDKIKAVIHNVSSVKDGVEITLELANKDLVLESKSNRITVTKNSNNTYLVKVKG